MSNGSGEQITFDPTGTANMRSRLRGATSILHARVERHFDLDNRVQTRHEYRTLLEMLWGIHRPMELALIAIDWKEFDVEIRLRRKTRWLESDLICLGAAPGIINTLKECTEFPPLNSVASGLGALYVIEGSTLGGRVILDKLQPRVGISAREGGNFLSSYGPNIGAMWRSYLTVLERFVRSSSMADVVERSALDTFCAFDRWFSDMKLNRSCDNVSALPTTTPPRMGHVSV